MRVRTPLFVLVLVAAVGVWPGAALLARAQPAQNDFINFESSHVHPLALDAKGRHLYAVNTPEARLAIFEVRGNGSLRFRKDIPVGLEPVSVALRPGAQEAWVANHLSDSVSVIDLRKGKLVATIPVGDEPTDVVFAGGRAFVSLAGVEDRVAVYDPESLEQIASIDIHGEEPRALAASPDGARVAVVVLDSGNQTTVVRPHLVDFGGGHPPPDPPRSLLNPPPSVGLIVRFNPESARWEDEIGRDWSPLVPYSVADWDLFWIDASADSPSVVEVATRVGTTLFDVAIHPITGDAWVGNTDARNFIRFEPNLRGHLVDTQLTIVPPGGEARILDLNPHIDFSVSPGPPEEIELSLAQPGDGEFSTDGALFYLAAFGSSKVAVLDGSTAAILERIDVPEGPSGVALNERKQRLYVMSRFENSIAIVDTARNEQVGRIGVSGRSFFDPSPPAIREGRRFLYDARTSSGHGDQSCATCHVFANFDGLAWDLGNPIGSVLSYSDQPWLRFGPIATFRSEFDPMKGPMTTQTLRGLRGLEPFHWRGDRRDFQAFNPAFDSLLGREGPLDGAAMDAFTEFIETVTLPPNPHRNVDDSFPETITGGDPANGELIFRNKIVLRAFNFFFQFRFTCNDCHKLPLGTGSTINGVLAGDQDMKIPHLRNTYEKAGFDPLRDLFGFNNTGNQFLKAGFGAGHDGTASPREFVNTFSALNESERNDVTDFLHAFSTGTFPCVGVQQTVDPETRDTPEIGAQLELLIGESERGHCDLVAKGRLGRRNVGYVYDAETDAFLPDSQREDELSPDGLIARLARTDVLTFTAVPAGSGWRLGIDRDRDGCLDGDDQTIGADSDPRHCKTRRKKR